MANHTIVPKKNEEDHDPPTSKLTLHQKGYRWRTPKHLTIKKERRKKPKEETVKEHAEEKIDVT